ncbi:hypothetical protein CLU79DRAFT_723740 [Phycomyces nitens]|nr:hypothetical protein CLU79DRAFT_723740 [Phycomyces nitens]
MRIELNFKREWSSILVRLLCQRIHQYDLPYQKYHRLSSTTYRIYHNADLKVISDQLNQQSLNYNAVYHSELTKHTARRRVQTKSNTNFYRRYNGHSIRVRLTFARYEVRPHDHTKADN